MKLRFQPIVRGRGHQTHWAAQFAVASELCKRGYELSFTIGPTTPMADLMVVSPERKQKFLVHVKGLYRKNPWLIKRRAVRQSLFYVLAYMPAGLPNQFYVMTQEQAHQLIQSELKRLKRADDYPVTGFVWSAAQQHRDAWQILPK
jgi:hypothetical protein